MLNENSQRQRISHNLDERYKTDESLETEKMFIKGCGFVGKGEMNIKRYGSVGFCGEGVIKKYFKNYDHGRI